MKILPRAMWTQTSRDDGQATVLLVIFLLVIGAMAALTIDIANAFENRRQTQNAVDAAALAAAPYLPSTSTSTLAAARTAAIDYAAKNGVEISPADIVFSKSSVDNDTVTVHGSKNVSFFFGGFVGIASAPVGANAKVAAGQLTGKKGVEPWGLQAPVGGFHFGQTYCLKLGSGGQGGTCAGATQGNFQALDIDSTGNSSGNYYRSVILSGSATVVRIGDLKNINTGNMDGPTNQGTGCTGNSGLISGNTQTFSSVIRSNSDGTYTVLDWNSPRLVVIPEVTYPNAAQARVVGFLVFFIENCTGNGAVTGKFVDTVVPDGEWGAYIAGTAQPKVIRLLE